MTKKELAEFEDLKKVNKTILQDNVALMKENKSLKEKICGYITSNANYKAKNVQLALDLEHSKKNEAKLLEENEKCRAEILEKNRTIKEKDVRISTLAQKVQEHSDELTFIKANQEYILSLPWYKRILPLRRLV